MALLTKFFILQWYTLIHGIGNVCGGGCREGGGAGLGGRSCVGGAIHVIAWCQDTRDRPEVWAKIRLEIDEEEY